MILAQWRIRARLWRALALTALAGLLLLRVPYAASHMDLARDMFVAWRLRQGLAFPLEGPILASTIHLGPLWYYLLAILQALGRNWFGTVFLLGVVAALQVPMAYLVGKEVHSRRAGFLWAAGLIVPCWTTYEWMLPLHPMLSPLAVLSFLLCCRRYWCSGRRRYFYGMILAFAFAVHAHPSNLGCAWIGLFVLVRARHPRVHWWDWPLAGLLGILPLAPFFYADAMQGFADLHKSAAYLTDEKSTGSLANLPALFVAVVYGGTRYLFAPMSGWTASAATLAAGALALGGLAGAAGLVPALRDPVSRRMTVFGLAAALLVLLTVVLIRNLTPYYMTSSSHVLLAGIVAIGLAALGATRIAVAARGTIVALAVLSCLATSYGYARMQTRGAWPFAWYPMFNVIQPPSETAPLLLTPAYAMDSSGRFLCGQPAPSIHGTYGSQLIHNYAMDMRLQCGRADVHVGGSEPERSHWLGLSRAMFAQAGIEPQRRVGPIGLVPARPITQNPPYLQPDEPRYPAYLPPALPPETHHLRVALRAGEHLAIANVAFAFNVEPQVSVRMGGRDVPAVAADRVAQVYPCSGCEAGTGVDIDIDVTSGDFADVDIVVF